MFLNIKVRSNKFPKPKIATALITTAVNEIWSKHLQKQKVPEAQYTAVFATVP
jgi:hypothetical protein